eukprot:TRINITY_DN24852_c0_g1_i2.p1 TRINITY_DN24852_c0_g1~~TRINITY_DN24852_c0_g1_i2.p1  ORF type:complete len:367 (-),score=82.77 TRINITY_DN24852_c0_g1_i2:58-1122(-)
MAAEASSIDDRPVFSWPEVSTVAARFGDFELVKTLPSERDLNFLLRPAGDTEGAKEADFVVFKVHNPNDSKESVECQSLALERAAASGASCQRLLRTRDSNEAIVALAAPGAAQQCLCRALSFLPGQMLADAAAQAAKAGGLAELFKAVGQAVGGVTAALLEFKNDAAHKEFVWDLQLCDRVIGAHMKDVAEDRQPLLQKLVDRQRARLAALLPKLRRSIVHNDPNDYNLVVSKEGHVGVLDFGDMVYSYTCADAAICMAYLLFHVPEGSPLAESMLPFVDSFHQQCPLEKAEVDALFSLAVMRVCTSVSMSAYQSKLDPENEYLLISAGPAWRLLERLDVEPQDAVKRQRSEA